MDAFDELFFVGDTDEEEPAETPAAAPRPGSFPVPPMPAGGAVRGGAKSLTFETSSVSGSSAAPEES